MDEEGNVDHKILYFETQMSGKGSRTEFCRLYRESVYLAPVVFFYKNKIYKTKKKQIIDFIERYAIISKLEEGNTK